MKDQRIECPFCGNVFKVEADWIVKNGRVFCESCCKAFDVRLEQDKSDYYGEFYD